MKLSTHIAVSALVSGLLYMVFKSWGAAFASFVSGVFIDLDHIIDYILEYGWHINIKKFFKVFYNAEFKRLYLILHSWEFLLLLAVSGWLTGWNPWITGTLIGAGQHLICDQITNRPALLGYSLIWRWKKKFDRNIIILK